MHKIIYVFLATFLLAAGAHAERLLVAEPTDPQPAEVRYVEGEVIVWFTRLLDDAEVLAAARDVGPSIGLEKRSDVTPERVLLSVPSGREEEYARRFELMSGVLAAAPNFVYRLEWTPDDQLYYLQWHYNKPDFIYLEEAWDINRGGDSSVIIAVLDTGVAYEEYTVPSYEQDEVIGGTYHRAPELSEVTFVSPYDFILPSDGRVELAVYDLAGRRVATPIDAELTAGRHETSWNCSATSPGVYLVHLSAPSGTLTNRVVITR